MKNKNFTVIILSSIIDNSEEAQEKAFYECSTTDEVRELAQAGNPYAMIGLGWGYQNGNGGLDLDYEKAFYWYKKAADAGFPAAFANIGHMYSEGQFVEQDYEKAVENYIIAANKGLPSGHYHLGECYFYGNGITQDYAKAVECFKKTIELDHDYTIAIWNLAICYENALGVEEDLEIAFEYCIKAAQKGHPYAQCKIGMNYLDGKIVEKDEAEGIKWIKMSAEQNYNTAQYILGLCYDTGRGVEEDEDTAFYWYNLAAKNGHQKAIEIIKEYE